MKSIKKEGKKQWFADVGENKQLKKYTQTPCSKTSTDLHKILQIPMTVRFTLFRRH